MNNMMLDIDPLSSYDAQYDYPLPNPHSYPHPPHTTIPYPYKNEQAYQNYTPQIPYQPTLPQSTEVTEDKSNVNCDAEVSQNEPEPKEEEDVKPDITVPQEKPKRSRKIKGKTSSYWNKKIMDKNFAFYGCSVCNIAYTDLQELDQHVIIHSNRMTSYDLRMQNIKKRKLLKKEKKKQKKNSKVKKELEIDIKPEDGYIGTEKATEFNGQDDKSVVQKCPELSAENAENTENNENTPANTKKSDNKNYINVYKCFGCNKQFALSYYLRIHVRSHTDEKPYTCNVCGQSFITASKLGRHNKRIHLSVTHQCRICYKYFNRFELLVQHFDTKHAEDKLEGEPYDYYAILPYLKELEDQLVEENEKTKPKTEDPWDLPLAVGGAAQDTLADQEPKEEKPVPKEEDQELLPTNIEFIEEIKDTEPLPTANVTIDEVKVDFEIKEEPEDVEDNQVQDSHVDDHGADGDDDVKPEMDGDSGSDEEYFPTDTWVRSPSPLSAAPSPCAPRRGGKGNTSCQICNKKLSSKSYLRVHMRTHTGEKPFSCYICGRGFITASKMHRHVLTHDESWEDKDGIKKEAVSNKTEETENPENSVKAEPETDEDTTKKTKKKTKLKKTKTKLLNTSKKAFFEKKSKKYKKWPHECEFCHKRFLHLETLQVHKKSHDGSDVTMKCHFCLEGFSDKGALTEHEASHTGPKPYVCTTCGNTYKKKGTMVYHRKTRCKPGEGDDKTFQCDICSKRYNTQTKLQRHIISHTVCKYTLRYECPVCAHMFHTRYHVQMHLKSHMKEGLILEENRNAVLAMVLQNARKIPKSDEATKTSETDAPSFPSSDERSRICNICGQIFHHFYYLEEHLKTHGNKIAIQDEEVEEKKYTCQVCSKSFKLHYYLKLHSYTHTKEKPFICQQCGKGFITKGKLKRHLETHQGLKKYQCHICYKFFTRPSYLRIHVRTIHGTQYYNFRDYGIGVPICNAINDS